MQTIISEISKNDKQIFSYYSLDITNNDNVKNVFKLLPNQTHYWQGTTLRLQPWSYKWIVKKLKKNPHWTIDDLNESLEPTERDKRRAKMAEHGPLAM